MRKPNKIWIDKGSEFYNSSFYKWLKNNDIEMYSTQNEGTSVAAERFIRNLKNKIYTHMAAVSENVNIDKLDDIVNECNNTYHRIIKMEPIEVKDIDSIKEVNIKILNLKLVIMLEYQNTKTFLLKDILQIGLNRLL